MHLSAARRHRFFWRISLAEHGAVEDEDEGENFTTTRSDDFGGPKQSTKQSANASATVIGDW